MLLEWEKSWFFWRDEKGCVFCLRDRCIHRGVRLSTGKVVDGNLQCPFHGFEYEGTGRVTRIPANGRDAVVPKSFRGHRYLTHEAHGFIWIYWAEETPNDLKSPPATQSNATTGSIT